MDSINKQSKESSDRLLIKLLMNISSLCGLSFTMIVSLSIIIYIFISHQIRTSSKKGVNISLLLTCNTCVAIICSSLTIFFVQLMNVIGDRNVISMKWMITRGCLLRGYLLNVFIYSIYLSFVLQACYRLFRIVFHHIDCLPKFPYYILLTWIISFVLFLPTLITNGSSVTMSIVYLSEEFYCQLSMKNISLMFYLMLIIFILPIFSLCLIYFWIILHIRNHQKFTRSFPSVKRRRRNHRDRIILQRICLVVFSLSIPVVVSVIIFIAFIIHGHWIFYRLNWMIISISYIFISLSSIYITPEIYRRRNPRDSSLFIPSKKRDYSALNALSSGQIIELDFHGQRTFTDQSTQLH